MTSFLVSGIVLHTENRCSSSCMSNTGGRFSRELAFFFESKGVEPGEELGVGITVKFEGGNDGWFKDVIGLPEEQVQSPSQTGQRSSKFSSSENVKRSKYHKIFFMDLLYLQQNPAFQRS